MTDPMNILILCTGNSARSILGEALINHLGGGRLRGFSAGSFPKGRVHPGALAVLARNGVTTDGATSKSWDVFTAKGAPPLHIVITVCDNAAGEICPIFPGSQIKAHWGIEDPADAEPGAAEEAAFLPAGEADQYIAGLILLGAAPCTAMVFVWSQMTKGDPAYTLVQVAVNDLIMIVAFVPIVALLLGVTDISVPWDTLLLSVLLYVVIPLAAGAVTRSRIIAAHGGDTGAVEAFTARLKPWSIIGLLATVVLLFAFQAETIVANPLLIALIAVPIILQSYGIFALAYGWAKLWRVPHNIAAPCALIGTSNFFELAVAVAIGLFGLSSGAALATVVGVLVEVPVMLSLVAIANRTRGAFGEEA